MNKLSAYDLAVELCNYSLDGIHKEAADMLRYQANIIEKILDGCENVAKDKRLNVDVRRLAKLVIKDCKGITNQSISSKIDAT